MVQRFDYLVIGSGIAGMSFALKVANEGKSVALICKAGQEEANTYFAQGGIASVTNLKVDNFEKHIEDTMIAGDWISDRAAVEKVVREAPAQIEALIRWGVNFDKKESGEFDLHKEGGHSEFRILHHADNTGAEIQTSLIETVNNHPNITVFTNHYAVEIITQHHMGIIVTRHTPGIKCFGAYVLNEDTGEVHTFLSKITVMATGGCEAVYRNTTNPLVATGDGIAMVYRAKGSVKDMEFIQFHPTALYHPGDRPSFLITEAMRGYGAVLRNLGGEEFMHKYDPRLSLAPRDIVARAIDSEMKQRGEDHVYLDVTHKDPEETKKHFPNIYKKCLSLGIDITKDYIPVAPAAHYLCGGIKVDLNGQSSIRRLYAIGECSCTGLHGGNRLASNSLIEAVVYADAAAKHSLSVMDRYEFNQDVPEWNDEGTITNEERVLITQSMKEVNQIMEAYVGIVRSNTRLIRAWNRLDILYEDDDLLVVNKPKGMVVHPAPGHYSGTLVNALLYHCKDLSGINGVMRPGIVHRIDKDTSGLLVVAKNDVAHESLSQQLQDKTCHREYVAIVHNPFTHEHGTIHAPIGRDEKDRQKMAVTANNSKDAITHFTVLENFKKFAYIKCQLETGRTHQIRVHMQYIEHPIAGDPKYGPRKTIQANGQLLHACALEFVHPTTKEKMRFEIGLEPTFKRVLNELREGEE